MGAKKEGGVKAEGEKKEVVSDVSVFEMYLYCEGCAKKVKAAIKRMKGVEKVKADTASNKVTVKGNVDPTQIKARIERKTDKKVEIISPLPKKDAGAGGGDEKAEEKAEKKKPPKERTVDLKIRPPYCPCDFDVSELKEIIKQIEGVNSVEVDQAKDLVTVKGTMETKELERLRTNKLINRNVEVLPHPPPPKKEEKKKESNKNKEGGGGEVKPAKKKGEEKLKRNAETRDELRKKTLQLAKDNLEKEVQIMKLKNQCKIPMFELAKAQEKLSLEKEIHIMELENQRKIRMFELAKAQERLSLEKEIQIMELENQCKIRMFELVKAQEKLSLEKEIQIMELKN